MVIHCQQWGNARSKPSHVIGKYNGGDVYVEVAEPIADVRHLARQEAFIHALCWLSLAVVAVALIDSALLRTVFKPVNHLSSIVRSLRERDFDVEVDSARSSELGELGNEIRSMADQLRLEDRHHTVAMKRATSIQQHLLPRRALLPGLDVATHYCPAVDVAGDIFDFQELADGNWLLYVADVVGHGVPAALSAAILKMLVESSVAEIVSESDDMPAQVIERINCRFDRYFCSSELITMVILLWCPRTKRMHKASAGHEPVWFMTDGRVHALESTGIPLGVSSDAEWQTRSVELAKDDLVILSTDGLAECMSDQGELLGRKRVRATLSSIQQRLAQQVVNELVSSLEEFRLNNRPSDDLTIVVLQLTQ